MPNALQINSTDKYHLQQYQARLSRRTVNCAAMANGRATLSSVPGAHAIGTRVERMIRFIVLMLMPARKAYVATSAVAGALNAIPPGPCARPGPMTRARSGLVMRAWRGQSARASSLPIHTHPGSAAPTRTPTVFCGSMSRRDALVGVRPK